MNFDQPWCHDCNVPVRDYMADFVWHANRRHIVTNGPCLGPCQFRGAA